MNLFLSINIIHEIISFHADGVWGFGGFGV